MNHDDELPDDPYRTPGRDSDKIRPEDPAHTPYTYDESKTVVRRFALVGGNRHNPTVVECDLEHPELPAMVIRTNGQPWLFYEAKNKRAYGERVGQSDTASGAVRDLVSEPPRCPYDCPACRNERYSVLNGHIDSYGESLGSLDIDHVIRPVREPVPAPVAQPRRRPR